MPLRITSDFDYTALHEGLAKFSSIGQRVAKAAPMKAARAFTRRVVDITPPASAGRTGLAARRQGERRIDSDLRKIFAPVILKGKRREQWPDVEAIYNEIFGSRKGRPISRTQQPYHVDARKLEVLRQKLYARVGYLAGGWNAAAAKLGVDLPAWITRHGTDHGTCDVTVTDNGVLVVLTNQVEYSGDVDGYPRRVQAALDYEGATLVREADHLLALEARKAGVALV